MADRIKIKIENPLGRGLRQLPQKVKAAVNKVVEETSDRLFQRIKNDTPRDRGDLAGAWSRSVTTRGRATIRNTRDYANVAEFGGWPVIPNSRARTNATGPGLVRGQATLGGYPPGPRTQIAPGGSPTMLSNVSRQAPKGMVRQNLDRITDRFVFDLEEAIDRAFAEIQGGTA